MQLVKHNLTSRELSVIDTTPPALKPYLMLRLEAPASQLSPEELKAACFKILVKAIHDDRPTGATDDKVLQMQTQAMIGEIKGKLAELTVSEIEEAFYRGVRGESGPYFGMCAKTYHQFMSWYRNLPERSECWVKYLQGLDELKTSEKPVYYTPEKLKQIALEAFEDYKNSGKLPFVPHSIYDTIKNLMGVSTLIDKKSWQEVKEQAKKGIVEKSTSRKKQKSVNELLEIENLTFEFECKKVGLKLFFDKLIQENKPLNI